MTTPATFLTRLDNREDWARKLADPSHMKVGRSAHGICTTWLAHRTFPQEIRAALDGIPTLENLQPLLVVAEHQVPLPGGRAASQCDAWVLARRPSGGLVSIAIEAKVDEPFGETLDEWLVKASPGKRERLAFLYQTLGVSDVPGDVRYQLLHRAAAPILEAKRFGADTAVLVVQSFDPNGAGRSDFDRFVAILNGQAPTDDVASLGIRSGIQTWAAWVRSTC